LSNKSKIEELEKIIEAMRAEVKESSLLFGKEKEILEKKCREYRDVAASIDKLKA
jgi:hypothetical protein